MTIETWMAFTAAAVILIAVPGPTVMLVISYALSRGKALSSGRLPES